MRRSVTLAIVGLLLLGACGSPAKGTLKTGVSNRVSRPRPGSYVYELHGSGTTQVPVGALLTDTVSVAGDVITTKVTNNQNANTRQFEVRREPNRVVQLNNQLNIKGTESACTYNPPLVLFRIPIRVGRLPTQTWAKGSCADKVEVEVVRRERVTSADGRTWQAWRIETITHSPNRTATESSWLSPDLGRYVKIETTTEEADFVQRTTTLLADYPSS